MTATATTTITTTQVNEFRVHRYMRVGNAD